MLGDVRDEVQPRQVAGRRVLREMSECVEEPDEDRQLGHQRQTRGGRVDVVLLVELHQLFVELRPVALVLPLDLLHLRRVRLHVLHRVDLLHRQGNEQHPDDDREPDDRPRPGQAQRVERVQDVPEQVLERRENARDDHLKTFWSRAWSTPPPLQGLHRSRRQPASTVPLKKPNSLYASIAYWEQDGWYLHCPTPRNGARVNRYAQTAATPTYLMRRPS